jgi:hypothetical protein
MTKTGDFERLLKRAKDMKLIKAEKPDLYKVVNSHVFLGGVSLTFFQLADEKKAYDSLLSEHDNFLRQVSQGKIQQTSSVARFAMQVQWAEEKEITVGYLVNPGPEFDPNVNFQSRPLELPQ